MGVMLQAFYWDCPQTENREHQWWSFIKSKLPAIAQAGFTALWPCKVKTPHTQAAVNGPTPTSCCCA